MATVKVKGFSVIRDVFGANVVELDVGHPETVKAALDALLQTYRGAPQEGAGGAGHRGDDPVPARPEWGGDFVDPRYRQARKDRR